MTQTQLRLGYAPATGRHGMDACSSFKRELWRRIGRNCDGAYLISVSDRETQQEGIAVVYERGDPEAENWALRAADQAKEVWAAVAKQGKERAGGRGNG